MNVYVAADRDFEMQDTECQGCFEPVGQAPYVYGPNGHDVFHKECWDEACQATPDTEVPMTFDQRACFAFDKHPGW